MEASEVPRSGLLLSPRYGAASKRHSHRATCFSPIVENWPTARLEGWLGWVENKCLRVRDIFPLILCAPRRTIGGKALGKLASMLLVCLYNHRWMNGSIFVIRQAKDRFVPV